MAIALFVGRFQPFHKGHEHAIKSMFERFDEIVIAVGSTNKKNRENPFTFEQRKKMIDAVLKKYKDRYKVIAIDDVISDAKWRKDILEKAKFDVVVSRNNWTKKCFKDFVILEQALFSPKIYDASRIRKLIRGRKKWEDYVPGEVVEIISKSKVSKKATSKTEKKSKRKK